MSKKHSHPSIKSMNKIRCCGCRKLVRLEECTGVGYSTTKSGNGYEKLISAECHSCVNKGIEECLEILKDM
jgi:hypothetical protein